MRSKPLFGTSIAIEFKENVVLGVIYMPFSNELYLGCKGKGSYLNGKRIRVSKRNIREATMIYGSVSYVAEGKVDLEIEYTDKIWDFAAGAILVEEAGGQFYYLAPP